MNDSPKVIAIDGPAGAGKSTIAKRLAQALGYAYLDTGAMYRALTFKALQQGAAMDDEAALVSIAQKTKIDIKADVAGVKVLLDGKDVSQEIRSLEVTNNTFYVARAPKVRAIMVEKQREIAGRQSVVMEGRDIGTVVFPQTPYKFYLDATAEERTHRRARELKEQGKVVDEKKLYQEIVERDEKDKTRSVGALKVAPDAIFIESTKLSVDQVVEKLLGLIKNHGSITHS